MTTELRLVRKDPDATLDYGLDWADGGANDGSSTDTGWLQGDTISTSAWSVDGPDSDLVASGGGNDDTTTSITLTGGTAGETYTITNRITTVAGLIDDRSISVEIVER